MARDFGHVYAVGGVYLGKQKKPSYHHLLRAMGRLIDVKKEVDEDRELARIIHELS